MAHWEHRPEPNWPKFHFKQPYAKGLAKVRQVLAETDFDPATLWQWGTMQAMALLEVLKSAEAALGPEGQKLVYGALRRTGYDVIRQAFEGVQVSPDITEAEYVSFVATIVNRIAYASLEAPRIDAPDRVTFDILWCPHQDHYGPLDCRVQRYFVQGMLDAARDHARAFGFEVRFDSTIPNGAPTCHFTLWKPGPGEAAQWESKTAALESRALAESQRTHAPATAPDKELAT